MDYEEFEAFPIEYIDGYDDTDDINLDINCGVNAIRDDIDPLAKTRYSELSNISQRLVAKGSKSNNMSSLLKSELLQVEVKLYALARGQEESIVAATEIQEMTNQTQASSSQMHELQGVSRRLYFAD
ncbi:hypothetical protein FRX31_031728 [Thalictrum thalictroides]|uniref:Uncharacterized protein n=1 Tax=Thalictrum thalictroides TaxID=46969 RepID=A0A7J6V1W0_THATH|nr:hypothetical protein FRX31_031728 [Thalictrum thalictroides]